MEEWGSIITKEFGPIVIVILLTSLSPQGPIVIVTLLILLSP